jgi:hypothetical protein
MPGLFGEGMDGKEGVLLMWAFSLDHVKELSATEGANFRCGKTGMCRRLACDFGAVLWT